MAVSRDVLLARAYLARVAEPPAVALGALIRERGPVEAADLVRRAEVPAPVLEETSSRRHLDLADQDLAAGERVGARLVVPEDEEWPAWPLLPLDNAVDSGLRWAGGPLGLWARGTGSLAGLLQRAVSVVGARASTSYGEHVAGEFGHELASLGTTVLSGAAYGIDGAAHRGAIVADGPTVAVLGCGVDVGYPAGHVGLLDKIAKQGFVLSEYPPGTPPARHRFLVRNRIIACLGAGTVVVEAGTRSGARNTAATAAALGRVLMAVPGPVTSAMSAGCHELIRSGLAVAVSSVAEVIESVATIDADLAAPADGQSRFTDGLDPDSLRVHEALDGREGASAEQLAVSSGVSIGRVRAALPSLELAGLAERCDAGWRRIRPRSRSR